MTSTAAVSRRFALAISSITSSALRPGNCRRTSLSYRASLTTPAARIRCCWRSPRDWPPAARARSSERPHTAEVSRPYRLVADNDAARSEQILNVAKAEVKPKVQPHGVSDDLGREAIATLRRHVILGCGHVHPGEHLSLIVAQLENSEPRTGHMRA